MLFAGPGYSLKSQEICSTKTQTIHRSWQKFYYYLLKNQITFLLTPECSCVMTLKARFLISYQSDLAQATRIYENKMPMPKINVNCFRRHCSQRVLSAKLYLEWLPSIWKPTTQISPLPGLDMIHHHLHMKCSHKYTGTWLVLLSFRENGRGT